MKAFTVENTKNFMAALLGSEAFDDFLLEKAQIKTYNTFDIDGRVIPEFYDDYEFGYEFSMWKDMKKICFDLIKGKQLPVSFHFVLQFNPDKIRLLLAEEKCRVEAALVKSLTLNIKYINNEITVITATSFNTFVPDKSVDILWDEYVQEFIKQYI